MLILSPGNSCPPLFFFNDTATTEIYTLSLHDALPISSQRLALEHQRGVGPAARRVSRHDRLGLHRGLGPVALRLRHPLLPPALAGLARPGLRGPHAGVGRPRGAAPPPAPEPHRPGPGPRV